MNKTKELRNGGYYENGKLVWSENDIVGFETPLGRKGVGVIRELTEIPIIIGSWYGSFVMVKRTVKGLIPKDPKTISVSVNRLYKI